MKEMLKALNKPCCLEEKLLLFIGMFSVAGIYLIAIDLVHILSGISMAIIQLLSWAIWFVWQGVFFQRNRKTYLKNYPQNPYKAAYYRDILFGVAFGISQMLRPFYHGILHGTIQYEWHSWLFFFLLVFAGIGLMIAGFSVIGFAAAGFLFEFNEPIDKKSFLVEKGIYKVMRHPLFLGGTIASLGCGMIFNFDSKILGIINICILPVYHLVENHRQTQVLGEQYLDYRLRVGAFIPKLLGARRTEIEPNVLKVDRPDTKLKKEKTHEVEMDIKARS